MNPENNRFRIRHIAFAALLPVLGGSIAGVATQEPVRFPDGYRSWTHIASAAVASGGRGPGMHHIYANDKALAGYRTGRSPDGAMIVFDRFALQTNGAVTKIGDRQFVDVMLRDNARFRDTGGWGFDEFVGDSRDKHSFPPAQATSSCFTCHTQRKDSSYVFTSFRDQDRVKP